jgi:FO synthase
MSPEEIAGWSERAQRLGCREALMCLGDQPEAVSDSYRSYLGELGHRTTIDYVLHACGIALEHGLLPHSNPGLMRPEEIAALRRVNVSLGLMLETTSARLRGKGQVHYYAPDKEPRLRLAVIEEAGRQKVPFTTGLLIGIGETPDETVDALYTILESHARHGHIQEVIVQNFRAKPETPMAACQEPTAEELAATVAVTRLILGPAMNVQVPPNLSPSALTYLLESGINDFGGISPLTPDYVNPEAPWPHIGALARSCAEAGYVLAERLAIYPEFLRRPEYLDPALREATQRISALLPPKEPLGLGGVSTHAKTGENGLVPEQSP